MRQSRPALAMPYCLETVTHLGELSSPDTKVLCLRLRTAHTSTLAEARHLINKAMHRFRPAERGNTAENSMRRARSFVTFSRKVCFREIGKVYFRYARGSSMRIAVCFDFNRILLFVWCTVLRTREKDIIVRVGCLS